MPTNSTICYYLSQPVFTIYTAFHNAIPNPVKEKKYPLVFNDEDKNGQFFFLDLDTQVFRSSYVTVGYFTVDEINDTPSMKKKIKELKKIWCPEHED